MRRPSGFSLLELALVLSLAGILLLLATPALHHARDVFATRAARDYLITQLALARVLAPAHAGSELQLDTAAALLAVRAGLRVHVRTSLHERYGVALGLAGPGTVALHFDAIGLGRMSNRTITLTRGRARAGLSISAYGRARPW